MGGTTYYDYESSGDLVTPIRLNMPWNSSGDLNIPTKKSIVNEAISQKVTTETIDSTGDYLTVQDSQVLKTNVQLTGSLSDGFPNTTTTYIWNFDSSIDENQTDIIAGKVLTREGANALTASNDVLGVSRYNTCGAQTYLTSTDIAFNIANTADTDDFILGAWIYIPDPTPAATVNFISNNIGDGDNGYCIQLQTSGFLCGRLEGGVGGDSVVGEYIYSSGWYHIVQAREVGVGQYLYLNGKLVSFTPDVTIGTNQSKFQISGCNHAATSLSESGTRYDELFFRKGVLPTKLSDVIRNIYGRSAKKFTMKDQSGNVTVPETRVQNVSFCAFLSATSTDRTGDGTVDDVVCDNVISNTGSYNASSGVFTAPITGLYRFTFQISLQGILSGHTTRSMRITTTARTYGGYESYSLAQANYMKCINVLAPMLAGETAKCQYMVDGSTKVVDLQGGASSPFTMFSGELVN